MADNPERMTLADLLIGSTTPHPDDMTGAEVDAWEDAHPELSDIRWSYMPELAECSVTAKTRTAPSATVRGTGKTFREAAANLDRGA